jgi:hypothetical protein
LDLANGDLTQNFIITSDFNITRCLSEKRGGSIVRDQFREKMDDCISDFNLYDVPSLNGSFTWNNKRVGHGHIVARLDRFLINKSFISSPEVLSSQILP